MNYHILNIMYKKGFDHVILLFFVVANAKPVVAIVVVPVNIKSVDADAICKFNILAPCDVIVPPCKLATACKLVTSNLKPIPSRCKLTNSL